MAPKYGGDNTGYQRLSRHLSRTRFFLFEDTMDLPHELETFRVEVLKALALGPKQHLGEFEITKRFSYFLWPIIFVEAMLSEESRDPPRKT